MDNKDLITIMCKDCGCEFSVQYVNYKNKNDTHYWRCKKCKYIFIGNIRKLQFQNMSDEEKEKNSKLNSKNSKLGWSSPDYRKKHKDSRQKYFNSLSNEEKSKIKLKKQKAWESMSLKKRKLISEKRSELMKQFWSNPPEGHREYISKMMTKRNNEFWNNISEEDKIKILSPLIEAGLVYWDSISEEERLMYSNKARDRWNNMSSNKLLENFQLQSEGIAHSTEIIGQTEYIFKNDLNLYRINYKPGYASKIIHSDFYSIFNNNPVTGSNRINPFHAWDFILYFKNKSILIDVDGSIHDKNKTNFEVTSWNGIKFNLSDFISFNDSQRPYQTDGMNAYIIEAYDDKLENSTEVLNINTNKYITYKEFIEKLRNMKMYDSITKKELREVMKENR